MTFHSNTSKIAITIPHFTLLKSSEGLFGNMFGEYNEPYIVSTAIDANASGGPQIEFNAAPFPKTGKGQRVEMIGDGHLLYGPKNPGEFVAVSALFMECDADIRERGAMLETVVKSQAVELGIAAIIAASPGASALLGVLRELTNLVAGFLKKNGDDELLRVSGSFLRDQSCPYHINRRFQQSNDYIETSVQVLPLESANGQGSPVTAVRL